MEAEIVAHSIKLIRPPFSYNPLPTWVINVLSESDRIKCHWVEVLHRFSGYRRHPAHNRILHSRRDQRPHTQGHCDFVRWE